MLIKSIKKKNCFIAIFNHLLICGDTCTIIYAKVIAKQKEKKQKKQINWNELMDRKSNRELNLKKIEKCAFAD